MDSIYDLVKDNERVVAVFTTHDERNINLQINSDGTGYTGNWVLRQNPNVEYVVIYHRETNQFGKENKIYKATISSIEGPLPQYDDKKRYKIHFNQLVQHGLTNATWSEFADCGANPVRYINA